MRWFGGTRATPMTVHSLLAPGIESRLDRVELARRLRRVDLAAVDIDECLFPGFSQTHLGYLIFYYILTRPRSPADLKFVPQLLRGGAYIRRVGLLHRLGRTPTNIELMTRYERSMMGIPEVYFVNGARTIPARSYPGVRRLLERIGRRVPTGLISFGIHLIAEEYMAQLNAGPAPCVAFAEANRIRFARAGEGGPRVFTGYEPPLMTSPADKLALLERRLERAGASCPLVVGNGRDEAAMADRARVLGGLSIGFQPAAEVAEHFDVVVRGPDWVPMTVLLGELLDVNP